MGLPIQKISYLFKLADYPSFLLNRVFIQACKSIPVEAATAAILKREPLPAVLTGRGFGSTEYPWNLQARLQAAESYVPEKGDREDLSRLILHRKILYLYALKVRRCIDFPDLSDALADELAAHIDRLDQSPAIDVLTDREGRRFFCLPGGNQRHMVVYEFVREADGSYTFMLYDKFATETPLHGAVRFISEGRIRGHTRVQFLSLSKSDLQNRDFLKFLIEAQRTNSAISMQDIREALPRFLKNGSIRRAPLETSFHQADPIEKAIYANELAKDCDFHSEALGECCTESNAQTPEHFIIGSALRKKLKRHSLAESVRQAGTLLDNEPALKRLAQEKL